MKKVLIVEDHRFLQEQWKEELSGKVEILSAFSISEAEEKFVENSDIDLIVMDACVPGNNPNTSPLVEKFRATFVGPMIATSSISGYRQQLMRAGCDYECPKEGVVKKLSELLDL
jgi:DNA-binding NarL/FixJ family response regulator